MPDFFCKEIINLIMKKNFYSLKGFTVAKFLIIVVVIGIVSAMTMLFSSESRSSKQASDIVVNLRNLKTATLAWYADHVDLSVRDGLSAHNEEILKYFTSKEGLIILEGENAKTGSYSIVSTKTGKNNSKVWYVGYIFSDSDNAIVREILSVKAKSLGLKFGNDSADNLTDIAGENQAVWMLVLSTPSN